jgi:hypothetical protein
LFSFLHARWLQPIAESVDLLSWIERVNEGLTTTNAHYPFLAYGTDWLAFAHLAIAVAFIGPYIDPVPNKWIITFGLIACGGVIPLALIAGHVRGIPLGWRLIDCSFGVFGAVPLVLCKETHAHARTREDVWGWNHPPETLVCELVKHLAKFLFLCRNVKARLSTRPHATPTSIP